MPRQEVYVTGGRIHTIGAAAAGAVALDAATLAALETIGLDAATLAALETINVGNFPAGFNVNNAIALDAATLAALETISVANFPATQPVSGTLALDAATLAALETISVANFPATQPVSGPLTDTQLRATPIPVDHKEGVALSNNSVKSAAPAIGAVQADTGALAAGDYDFYITMVASDTLAVGKGLVVEHRNAANAATLQNLGGVVAGTQIQMVLQRYTLALNERIRVIAGTAAGAASSMYVSAIAWRLA